MLKVKNKKILIGIIIIIVAAATYLGLRSCRKNSSYIYRYEKASIGEVKKTIPVTGTLEILNSYTVVSKIGGLVTNVYVDFNDNIKKNQLLATLDTTDIDQEILKINSRREAVTWDLFEARADLNAKRDGLKDDVVSKKVVESAEIHYKKIETQLNQIKSEYEIAKRNLNNTKILAPSSGVIMRKNIEPNITITAKEVLFIIAEDLRKMQLIIHVDESDIGLIKSDQNVIFSVSAFPDRTFKGKITKVILDPVIKDQLTSYQALVTCDNSELKLLPGMTATATVEIDIKEKVLRIPSEAFIVSPADYTAEDTGNNYVWKKSITIDNSQVTRIKVKTGLIGDYYTEIISDEIKPGDEILVGVNK